MDAAHSGAGVAGARRKASVAGNRAADTAPVGVLVQKKCRVASERNEAKRTAFRERITCLDPNALVFLDETGVSLALSALCGWGKKGKPLVEAVPVNRGKNLSVLGAVSHAGMLCTTSKLGAMKRTDVEGFLCKDLLPRLLPGSILVFDNATIHKGGNIKHLINQAGCHVLYLPPYSPDLNPIELVWAVVKGILKRVGPRDEAARQAAVESAVAALPQTLVPACFHHCGYHQTF